MVEGYWRDDAGERLGHHVGGVEPAAKPDLEQQDVGRMAGEQHQRRGGLYFKDGDRRIAVGLLAGFQCAGEVVIGHEHAATYPTEPEAFVQVDQIGRGVDMHPSPGRFKHRAHERDGRSFAVGAGHMDDRRQALFRMAQPVEHMPHAIEREIDALGMQRQQPREDGVYVRLFHLHFVSFASTLAALKCTVTCRENGSRPEGIYRRKGPQSECCWTRPCR